MRAIHGAYAQVLGILQPLGLLRGETPDGLRGKIDAVLDGEEEFLEQLEGDRGRTLSTLVAHIDPNALLNPGERAKAVAAWAPPLWKDLGLRGTWDPAARRVRIEGGGRVLADEPAAHGCHAAVAWTKALADRGVEVLVLDVGTDDESYVAVTRDVAEKIRRERPLAVAAPCPAPK